MNSLILSVSTIVILFGMIGISMADVAVAENQKTIITGTNHISTLMNEKCSIDIVQSEADVEWSLTIWPDGNKFMYVETRTSEIFDVITSELVGTSKSNFKQMGEFDGTGTAVTKVHTVFHCLNGAGVENFHEGITINKNGPVIHGKK